MPKKRFTTRRKPCESFFLKPFFKRYRKAFLFFVIPFELTSKSLRCQDCIRCCLNTKGVPELDVDYFIYTGLALIGYRKGNTFYKVLNGICFQDGFHIFLFNEKKL